MCQGRNVEVCGTPPSLCFFRRAVDRRLGRCSEPSDRFRRRGCRRNGSCSWRVWLAKPACHAVAPQGEGGSLAATSTGPPSRVAPFGATRLRRGIFPAAAPRRPEKWWRRGELNPFWAKSGFFKNPNKHCITPCIPVRYVWFSWLFMSAHNRPKTAFPSPKVRKI